jgi:hypothetical protein
MNDNINVCIMAAAVALGWWFSVLTWERVMLLALFLDAWQRNSQVIRLRQRLRNVERWLVVGSDEKN